MTFPTNARRRSSRLASFHTNVNSIKSYQAAAAAAEGAEVAKGEGEGEGINWRADFSAGQPTQISNKLMSVVIIKRKYF